MKDFAKSMVTNAKAEVAKIGNAQKDDPKAKQLWEEMQHAKKLSEDWAREINRTGDQTLKGSQKDAEEAYKKAKKAYEDYALNAKVGNKKIKGSYVTIDTSTGRVTFDDFAGKSFDVSRIDFSAGYELRVMQQQINDFKKAVEEAKSLAKQNGLI